ncbi:MAG: hypothetical protein V3U80_07510 [Flavobacteriaceae bacterium]
MKKLNIQSSLKDEFDLARALTNRSSIIKNDTIKKQINISSEIRRIQSPKSMLEINKLNKILNSLEKRCNVNVAEKYLNGYLENKGVKSFNEFVSKLD